MRSEEAQNHGAPEGSGQGYPAMPPPFPTGAIAPMGADASWFGNAWTPNRSVGSILGRGTLAGVLAGAAVGFLVGLGFFIFGAIYGVPIGMVVGAVVGLLCSIPIALAVRRNATDETVRVVAGGSAAVCAVLVLAYLTIPPIVRDGITEGVKVLFVFDVIVVLVFGAIGYGVGRWVGHGRRPPALFVGYLPPGMQSWPTPTGQSGPAVYPSAPPRLAEGGEPGPMSSEQSRS